jgi:hypothetical protein
VLVPNPSADRARGRKDWLIESQNFRLVVWAPYIWSNNYESLTCQRTIPCDTEVKENRARPTHKGWISGMYDANNGPLPEITSLLQNWNARRQDRKRWCSPVIMETMGIMAQPMSCAVCGGLLWLFQAVPHASQPHSVKALSEIFGQCTILKKMCDYLDSIMTEYFIQTYRLKPSSHLIHCPVFRV